MSITHHASRITHHASRITLLILSVYASLAIALTWPGVARLTTHLVGGRDDLWVHQWTFWWVKEALFSGQSPFYTHLLYYPHGVSLTSHNIAWFNVALWIPLQALFGYIAAYNIIAISVFALNAFTMYLFAFDVLRSRPAAFIAGLIFGFWPYIMSHYDHANMVVVFGVPLIMLGLRYLVRTLSVRHAVWTGLAITLTGIIRWQLLIMSAPVVFGYIAYLFLSQEKARTVTMIKRLLLAGILAAVLMAPLASPLFVDQFTSESPDDAFIDELDWGRTDLLAYVMPSVNNALVWRDTVIDYYEPFTVNRIYIAFLGYTTLGLALVGALGRWKKSWVWLALALLYIGLALGPNLAINGEVYAHIPMPYRLVQDWFIFRILRRPDRLNVFLSLPMAMLAGYGILTLIQSRRKRWQRIAITAAAALLILVEYSPIPYASTPIEVPQWHRDLADNPDEFAIFDLPTFNRRTDKWYMLYQITHGKPIVNGHVSRMPAEAFDFLTSTPFLDYLSQENLMDLEQLDVSHQLRVLAENNVRYLVVNKRFAHEGLLTIWQDWLVFDPLHEDDEVIVYSTDPQYGRDFDFQYALTPEVGVIKYAASEEAVEGGDIRVDIRWGTSAAPEEAYDACLLLLRAQSTAYERCYPIVAGRPSSEWIASEIARGFYTWRVDEDLEPGAYELAVQLTKAGTAEKVGERVTLNPIRLYPYAPQETAGVRWANAIDALELTAYSADVSADTLDLTLYWRATRPISDSYKVFVHVVDPVSGEVVAQSDAIPRNWTYPTNAWGPGEIVRDPVAIPVNGLAGEYELVVGLYNKDSGVRLPVVNVGQAAETVGDAARLRPIRIP